MYLFVDTYESTIQIDEDSIVETILYDSMQVLKENPSTTFAMYDDSKGRYSQRWFHQQLWRLRFPCGAFHGGKGPVKVIPNTLAQETIVPFFPVPRGRVVCFFL